VKRRAFFSLIPLLLAPAWAAAASGDRFSYGILWRIETRNAPPSHVFGTIHVSDPRLAALPAPAARAFASARSLTVEFTADGYAREHFLEAALFQDQQTLEDKIGAAGSFNPRKESVATFTLFGDAPDAGPDGSITSGSLAFSGGRLNIENSVALAIDQASTQSEGGFFKLNYSLVRLQNVSRGLQIYGAVSGQLASRNLDPVEKISLGGPLGVRAYPTGEAPGDAGVLGTLEARYVLPIHDLPAVTQAVAFIDSGYVRINKDPFAPVSNSRTLTGAGVGLNVFARDGLQLRASYAWALGDEQATGDDDRSAQGWIQIVKAF